MLVNVDAVWIRFEGQGQRYSVQGHKSSATAEMADRG